jgi:hypothetical protein
MSYATGCRCHGATFCPDLICVGYEDDVPVFVRRDSPTGQLAIAARQESAEQHDRSEYARLRSKYEPRR